GLAVLLGVLSLITVLVISFGVYTFFDSIFSGIDKVAETTAVEKTTTEQTDATEKTSDDNIDTPTEVIKTQTEVKNENQEAKKQEPAKTAAKVQTAQASKNVPDTGPGDILAVFIVTVGVGVLISQAYQRLSIPE
ncbi:MAG: hypothetical protein M3P98_00520, partial [bacterium]|nr:hypothetical protein [bacterium]